MIEAPTMAIRPTFTTTLVKLRQLSDVLASALLREERIPEYLTKLAFTKAVDMLIDPVYPGAVNMTRDRYVLWYEVFCSLLACELVESTLDTGKIGLLFNEHIPLSDGGIFYELVEQTAGYPTGLLDITTEG